MVVDAAWLEGQGYSRALRNKYVTHGWLDQVVRGVYRRPPAELAVEGDPERLRWQHVVISLQMLLARPVAVGGRTALELHGFAHYLAASGPREIHLYGRDNLPGWISKLRLDSRFVFHNAERLFPNRAVPGHIDARNSSSKPNAQADLRRAGLTSEPWGNWDWPVVGSTPERAVLELLDEVPRRETFHQADKLIEGLRNLRPRLLHDLLVDCRSVKVKRLFLWFAQRHNHPWLKRLDRQGIDLGRGKRMLVRGGKLDPEFSITVPEDLHASN